MTTVYCYLPLQATFCLIAITHLALVELRFTMYYNYYMRLIFVLSGHHILDAYVLQKTKTNNKNMALGIVYVTIIRTKK